jgi:membrane protein DedA with SNARE-associated domain
VNALSTLALPSLSGVLGQYGYLGLGVLVLVESFGVPLPGETAIIVSAGYAAAGHLNIVGVAGVAFVAAVTGDSIGYLIGRMGGRRLILKYGRYIRLTPARLHRVERFMARHGPQVVAVARFIDGLRQLNGIVAGATGMPWRRFVLFNAIGAAAWVGVWATAGYLAGDHITAIEATVRRYQWYAISAALLAAAGYAALHLALRRRRRDHE